MAKPNSTTSRIPNAAVKTLSLEIRIPTDAAENYFVYYQVLIGSFYLLLRRDHC